MASAALPFPAFPALSRAQSASSCPCVTRTSCRKSGEKALRWSAAATSHCRTVLGSTSHTRATARMPSPAVNAPTAHTTMSDDTRFPCHGVPCVSWQ